MNFAAAICLALVSADASGESRRPVDFATEVLPVLTKAGCNAGACHGAAAGRGGMHLSLLGADPATDYETIVQALEGRRVNLSKPERSLILTKPTGEVDHGGDMVLDGDGPGARRVLEWIRAGAPKSSGRRLTRLEVTPQRNLSATLPAQVSLKVVAQFDNGAFEDVTPWTVLTSSDSSAVEIDRRFVAHVRRRGQHVVIARFLDRVVPIQLSVPLLDARIDLTKEPRANFIDDEVLKMLADLRLPVAAPASDAEFLRRVSLDLTGRLPEPDVARRFLANLTENKREQLVDRLLRSESFADFWTLHFARQLRIHSLPNEKEIPSVYAGWLKQQLQRGTGLDQIARELLMATGDSHNVGPANFGRMVTDARGHAELVGQFLLGVRLGCANCHNHPLDKWTQDDYHGLAAVFARLDRGREVRVASRGAVTNLRTNEPAVPRIPGVRDLAGNGDHREEAAQWLTSAENRQFSRATVNRLWKAMFGRGLVEPVDDLRDTNPATHPELLDRLADDFVTHGYSIRHTLRQIALSHTYGRSGAINESNAADDRFYSRVYRKPLEPEVLLDAIADVTGVADEFAGQPAETRAVSLIDPLSPAPSLDVLGRCNRAGGCDDTPARAALPAQLHLLNGDLINRKLKASQGRLQQCISKGQTNVEIIQEFYMRGLCRPPKVEELSRWQKHLETENADERRLRLEDFAWSLLNSRQFMENH